MLLIDGCLRLRLTVFRHLRIYSYLYPTDRTKMVLLNVIILIIAFVQSIPAIYLVKCILLPMCFIWEVFSHFENINVLNMCPNS